MEYRQGPQTPYKVTAVPLDGGLDFVSPPSMVRPGTLTDCLNYEIVDRNGYRRIDGYYKWDNSYSFESDQQYEVAVTQTTAGSSAVGEFLCVSPSSPPFGIITAITSAGGSLYTIRYWRLSSAREPRPGEYLTTLRESATRTVWQCLGESTVFFDNSGIALNSSDGSNSVNGAPLLYPTDEYIANGVTSYDAWLKDRPVVGLKYFKDKAYMIMDAPQVNLLGDGFMAGDVIGDENQALILLNPVYKGGISTTQSDILWLEPSRKSLLSTPTQLRAFCPTSFTDPVLARTGASVTFNGIARRDLQPSSTALLFKSEKVATYLKSGYAGSLGNFSATSGGAISTPPIVSVGSDGGGFGAKAVGLWDSTTGLRSIALTSGGNGYTSAPTVTVTDSTGTSTGTASLRQWDWAGWRAVNTGWKFSTQNISSASGFLTKVDRNRGPSSQVAAYSTGSSEGLPFALDSWRNINIGGLPPSNINAQFNDAGSTDPTIVHEADSNRIIAGLRSSQFFGPFNTTPFGFRDFTSARDNIPTGSVVTGFEFNFTYYTNDFDSNTPPAASELVNYKAKAALYRRTLDDAGTPQYTLLSDIREAELTATGAAENVTPVSITIGASDDLWGVDGVTIDEITPDVGVAFWIEGVPTSGASFGYTFEIDTVNLEVNYRSPQVTYYFASGTGTERNVMSATLVSYHRESGELTQNNWKGDWQVADLGVEKYCASGSVGLVKITDGGSGYTTAPTVTFNDPISGVETGAAGTAIIEDGKVVGVVITNGGTGYTSATTVTFSAPGAGTTATGTVIVGALPGVQSGMGIYLDSALTTRIGFVSSDMEYNGLDSYAALEEEQSRYQIINANFYADEAWEGIYGVSGVGRAWYFDGNYFSRIYAIPLNVEDSARKDKPRHVCNYRFHLALGYKSGSVQFSKIGEPDNFDFVLGATEVGIGDRVTGIFPLPGQYLAVFCENSIWGITGKTVQEFSLENISPYSGAIEYSVVAIGDKPIYCDTMGISTLEQSDKYGNFLGTRLSHKISPWLLPRLTNIGFGTISGNSAGFVAAYPVRSKNQYRLWFRDGYQLVMSFVGPEQEPQFTFSRYLLGGVNEVPNEEPTNSILSVTNISQRAVVLALDSEVDENGSEHIIVSFDMDKSNQLPNTTNARLICPYVYRLDYTNQFGEIVRKTTEGEVTVETLSPLSIPAYFQTAFSTVENPFLNKTIRKLRLEGTSRGEVSLAVFTDKNYTEPSFADSYVNCSQIRVSGVAWSDKSLQKPWTALANVAETDRVVIIRIANFDSSNRRILDITANTGSTTYYYVTRNYGVDSFNITRDTLVMYPEPAHYVQAMLIQYEEGRQDA